MNNSMIVHYLQEYTVFYVKTRASKSHTKIKSGRVNGISISQHLIEATKVLLLRCAALKTGQFVSIVYHCAKMDY